MATTWDAMVDRVPARVLVGLTALIVLAAGVLVFTGGGATRTVTAHFSRAVSVYRGSDVRIMGVRVGTVTAVVPEGDSVRVVMRYDARFKVPADAKAAIVTPTLVADRYVQLAPAYTKGPVMRSGADIPLADTANPVELDRIYASLKQLTVALGPNGVNKDGTLDKVLASGASALKGRGALANRTIIDLAAATKTFGDNADPLFASVRNLAAFTNTLAENDQVVAAFTQDLAGVSTQLAAEKTQIDGVLRELAAALSVVKTFVRDNRKALTSNIEALTRIVGAVAKERDALITVLEKGPLGMNNLALAYDVKTGSIGSRVQVGPNAEHLNGFLCGVVANSGVPNYQAICSLFNTLLQGAPSTFGDLGAGTTQRKTVSGSKPTPGLGGLLGGSA